MRAQQQVTPRFLTVSGASRYLGVDRPQILAWEAREPGFPKRVALPGRAHKMFDSRLLEAWADAQSAEQRAARASVVAKADELMAPRHSSAARARRSASTSRCE